MKSRCEHLTVQALAHKGYDCFAPVCRQRRRWSDRMKEVEAPLFPGYVFCRFDVQRRLPILTTPGVAHVVGLGKLPQSIAEREIAAIQTVVNAGLAAQPWPYLSVGQRVRIEAGALAGVEGLLVHVKDARRLVLSVHLLQRSVAVEIDSAAVEPIH